MELLKYVSKYHFVEPGEMQHKEEEVQIDHKELKENMNKSCLGWHQFAEEGGEEEHG